MSDLYKKFPKLQVAEVSGSHRLQARQSVLRLAPQHGIGMEFGVFTGIFSEILAQCTRPSKLYLVDPWRTLHGRQYPRWKRYTANVAVPTRAAIAAATYRAEQMSTDCEVVEDFGSNWLAQKEGGFLDWVYLDANHTYESVIEDLNAIHTALKPDGLIMGDDSWVKPGIEVSQVYWAVRDFCMKFQYEIVHQDARGQWAITRASNLQRVGFENKMG